MWGWQQPAQLMMQGRVRAVQICFLLFFFFLDDGLTRWNGRLLAKDQVHLTREECGCLETCGSDQDDFNWKWGRGEKHAHIRL